VRPDALAVLRTGGRGVLLLVERDLGTEVTATLASKIARYRNKFAGRRNIHVGFVVEGEKRAESVRRLIRAGEDTGPTIIVTTIDALRADPFGARWSDGATKPPTRGLTPYATGVTEPLLGPGCLDGPDALAAFDHRAIESVPALRRLLSVGEATR
jgi:ribosomal protein S11